MGWETSDRLSRLPSDWKTRVARIKDRDRGRCTWKLPSGARCPRRGTEVDHIRNDDNHDLDNLRLLCAHHHAKKSAQEGVWGRKKKVQKRKRREELPPGLR